MKNAFREQVAMLFSWFKTWSDCEQTVAIYSLLKRSSPVQAKFLQQVLQHVLTDCNDVKEMEEKANDEEYVRSLRSKEKGVLHQLLQLFPLLKVGNNSAKAAYLDLIPEHLSHTILNGVNVEESRQLISFSLIHPALSPEEREPLHGWLVYLDDRLTYSNSNNFQNFNNANIGSSNRLAVGSSSSSSSGGSNNPSHSPSPVSPSHRSISQTSLCQENANQDYNQILPATNNTTNPNMLSPHILPKHSHSNTSQSPTPSIGIWQQQQSLQQQQQQHPQIPQGLSSGIDSGQGFNKVPGNFNNSNSLVVGHNSGGNSMSYNPLSVSLGQRSISQTSLCQDSQDHAPINSSGMRPLSGHSPGPSVHQWQQQQQQQQSNQQQLFQHSYQANQTALEPSPGHISLSGSNSDISRYSGQYNASSGNSHRTLRASNSHNMGAVEAPRGHMPLKATASAPPNFNSSSSKYQDKFSYPSSTGQKSHARLSRTRSLVPPSRWQGRDSQAPNASTSGSSSSLWWRQHPSKSSIGGGGGSTGHAPLSPQSSVTSSESSDSHHEDGPPTNDDFQEGPSRDLLLWLKEIRLHKYAYLFRNMTYEELPNLSEEWLLQNNVVRGARQRFMINIVKLRERQTLLRQLEKVLKVLPNPPQSIKGDESISQVLHELKAVLQTPIGPFDPEQQTHKQQPSSSSSSSGGDIDLTELHTSTTTTAATTTATTSTTNPTTPSSTSSSTGPESTTTTNTISESTSLSSSSSSSSSSTVTTLTTTSLSTTTPSAVPSSTSSSSSPSSPPTSTSSPSSQQPEASSDESGDGIAEGDLPSQIFRLLGKVCQELLRATGRDQHSFQMYLMLVRMVLHHDAFTADQKKSLESQVRTAEKLWRPTPHFYRPNTSWWRGKTYPVCDSYGSRVIPRSKRDPAPDSYQQQQLHWRQQQQQRQFQQQQQQQQQRQSQHHHATYHPPHHNYHQQQHHQQQQHVGVGVGGHQSWTSSGGGSSSASFRPGSQGGMGGHQAVTRNSSWNPAYLNKPGLMEPPTKQPLSRTQSAPINRPLTLPTHTPSVIGDDMEINASLDSLCEQMTEQALGNYEQGDVSKGSGFSMR